MLSGELLAGSVAFTLQRPLVQIQYCPPLLRQGYAVQALNNNARGLIAEFKLSTRSSALRLVLRSFNEVGSSNEVGAK